MPASEDAEADTKRGHLQMFIGEKTCESTRLEEPRITERADKVPVHPRACYYPMGGASGGLVKPEGQGSVLCPLWGHLLEGMLWGE